MAQRFDATAPLQVGGFTDPRRPRRQKRWLNVPETLIHSSNIATARIADEIGRGADAGDVPQAGLRHRPDIELREKGRPLWPTLLGADHDDDDRLWPWHRGDAAAPRQRLCRAGQRRHLAPGDAAARSSRGQAPRRAAACSAEATSARMRQLLRLIVLEGTGSKGDAPGFRVGGKTGTAESRGGRRLSPRTQRLDLRRGFPDGRAALCRDRDARSAQGRAGKPVPDAPPPGPPRRSSAA